MTGILYLAKNGLDLYNDKTKQVIKLNFGPEVTKDLEITNPDQLNLHIKSFVGSGKIASCALIMIVSHNLFFEKDFLILPIEQQNIETQKFLDNVPFETIRSKTFQSAKTIKIVATNGHFIDSVKKAFGALGFTVAFALPSMAFGIVDEGLNQGTIKLILSKYSSLKQYNLLNAEPAINSQPSPKGSGEEVKPVINKEKTNKKNLIAIGVFVLLIIILFIVVFFVLSSQSKSSKKTNSPKKSSFEVKMKLIVKLPIDKYFPV